MSKHVVCLLIRVTIYRLESAEDKDCVALNMICRRSLTTTRRCG